MELEIVIPENWSEVTLEKYLKFFNTIKPYIGTEEYERVVLERFTYYFCGIDATVIRQLPVSTFNEISIDVFKLIESSKKHELVKHFELGNTKYGFIPNLDDMSYGEYVDLSEYSKDTWENISELISVLYRPVVDSKNGKYAIQPYSSIDQDTIDMFKQKLTMDIVFGALSFFLRLQMDLMIGILTFSKKQTSKIISQPTSTQALTLEKNGVSMQQLQSLQETISQSLTTLQDSTSMPV
jgi:hypothetical protein